MTLVLVLRWFHFLDSHSTISLLYLNDKDSTRRISSASGPVKQHEEDLSSFRAGPCLILTALINLNDQAKP